MTIFAELLETIFNHSIKGAKYLEKVQYAPPIQFVSVYHVATLYYRTHIYPMRALHLHYYAIWTYAVNDLYLHVHVH